MDLQHKQQRADESQNLVLGAVVHELALLRSEMDARPSLEELQSLESRMDD